MLFARSTSGAWSATSGRSSTAARDSRTIVGFGCDANATHGAKDISAYGGWLAYRSA